MPTLSRNPITISLRILAAAAVVFLGLQTSVLTLGALKGPVDPFSLAFGFGLLALAIALALGVFAAYGVYRPTRAHLGVFVFLGIAYAGVAVHLASQSVIQALLLPDYTETASIAIGWLIAASAFVTMVATEWWLSKKAGFVAAERQWWSASNIRGVCIFTAWVGFFAFPHVWYSETVDRYIQPAYHARFEFWGFIGTIALCVLHGKLTPLVLMKITGVNPKPSPNELPEESRRRFRVY